MAKHWGVTSLVALALLGCLVGTEVEAQDWGAFGQKPASPMSKGAPPPQAQQVLPPLQRIPQYSQTLQVQPPPPQRTHQNLQTLQVQPPPPQRTPQYSQTLQVQPPPPQRTPQYSQTLQVQPPPPQRTPQFSQTLQVQPPPPQRTPQYSQTLQVQHPPPQKAPQYRQLTQDQSPPQWKRPQYPEASKYTAYPRTFSNFQSPQEPQTAEPQQPHQSYEPYEPQQPNQPYQPQQPNQPYQPHQPNQPYEPQQPNQPYQPYQPQQPNQPYQPQQPNQPHKPQQPNQPYQPQQPNQPYQPQQPNQPHKPQQPNQPYQPYQPQQPQQPNKPYQPQESHQPRQPHQPTSQQPSVPKQSSFQSCEVAESQKVPCGGSDISAAACEAISCCFDGRRCYFGKAVTVQCTKDAQFIVVVAKDATLPNIDLESLSLLGQGQGCTHVDSNLDFAIYNFPVTSCGSIVMEEPGVIIYENRMSSAFEVGVGHGGIVTRDSHYELLFQCRYTGTSVETLVVEVIPLQDPPLPVAALGPIRVHLMLANGECNAKGCNEVDVAYNSFYTDADYPVTKVLRDPVYVEVQLIEKTDPNLVLTLGRCWATTSANAHSLPQWDILIDGCPYRDDRYLSALVPVGPSSGLAFPSHYRRFLFKMFTFVDPNSMTPLKEQVYIHCSTAVCTAAAGHSCEPSCFRKKRDVNQRKAEPKVVVSVGPVIMNAFGQ